MNYINCPPNAYALMDSTRSMGYTLETAIADVMDNSIAGKASHIDIHYFHNPQEYISILDDGEGMDQEQMIAAMQYGGQGTGRKREQHDLGRFGLGLKTASLSQCNRLTVISKTSNGQTAGCRWDLSYIAQTAATGSWNLQILSLNEINEVPRADKLCTMTSGTLVVWEDLEPMKQGQDDAKYILSEKMEHVESHIALTFHRYLAGEAGLTPLKIRINDHDIQPADPFFHGDKFAPTTLLLPGKVMLTTYLMPFPSKLTEEEKNHLGRTKDMRQNQGFYVYRNKRLIQWGKWYRLLTKDKITEIMRFQLDLPNDTYIDKEWMLDVKKSQTSPPRLMRDILRKICERIHDDVKGRWIKHDGDQPDHKQEIPLWQRWPVNDKVVYKINPDHPLIENIREYLPRKSMKDDFAQLLRLMEKTLPLHQLTLDCEHDCMDDDNQLTQEEAEQYLRDYLGKCEPADREKRKQILRMVEPFCQYPDIFERMQ